MFRSQRISLPSSGLLAFYSEKVGMLVEGLGRGLIGLIYVFKGLLGLSVENRSPGRQARGPEGGCVGDPVARWWCWAGVAAVDVVRYSQS